jgi:poly-gamma-glutamate synthesis protein (capsule biosynthesis protein)
MLLVLAGLVFSAYLFSLSRLGNPLAVEWAICRLQFGNADVVKFDSQPEKYIIKTEAGYTPLISLMKQRGWLLSSQEKAQLVFTGSKGSLTAAAAPVNDRFQVIRLSPGKPAKTAPRIKQITLTAAGDILMHNTQIASGLQADGSYRFDSFFIPVKKLLEEGAYCSTNLEAALAGPQSAYTGYPMFNSPDAVADTLKQAGFDLVVTANNHCLDRGYAGGVRTLQVLHQAGLDTVGTYASAEDSRKYLVKNIDGIKVAYLAYTYSTNGIPVPDRYAYYVNMLESERVVRDINSVRSYADIVIVVAHWGIEYNPGASDQQKELAAKFFKAGADIILGSHPHVIEPMEVMKVDGQDKFVIYSMGNFIGHQRGL